MRTKIPAMTTGWRRYRAPAAQPRVAWTFNASRPVAALAAAAGPVYVGGG